MKCPRCKSVDVISIRLNLGDGNTLSFSQCHNCESKSWRSERGQLSLREALDLTASHRPV